MKPLKSGLLLFCLLLCFVTAWAEGGSPGIRPGVYDRNLILDFKISDGEELFYRVLTEENGSSSAPILYRVPLSLSALPGEERGYLIQVFSVAAGGLTQKGTYRYTIDRRLPHLPRTTLPGGVYTGPQEIRFLSHRDRIYYTLDADIAAEAIEWSGESIELLPRERPYTLQAYAKDEAGNSSALTSWEYTVQGRETVEERLRILSPVSGSFLNRQYLYIEHAGFKEILYTVDGSDPRNQGIPYREGVLLEESGEIELQAIGRRKDGSYSNPISVRFSVAPGELPPVLLQSGSYQTSQRIRFGDLDLRYTFEERRAQAGDLGGDTPITLSAPPRGLAYYALRFRMLEEGLLSKEEYRLFYLFDTRIPGEPLISIAGEAPFREPPLISLSAAGYAKIYYTLDGSSPTENALPYEGAFRPSFPDQEGSILIKAVAYGTNGRRGDESGRLISYDTKSPQPPTIEARAGAARSINLDVIPASGAKTIFEISLSGDAAPPDIDSPLWSGERIEIPYGMDTDITINFASRDQAGNISEPVTFAQTLDRLPPPRPTILVDEERILIEGAERLFYTLERIDTNGNEAAEYIPYNDPPLLPEVAGELIRYRISSYAEDQYGNRSATAFKQVAVDRKLPVVPFIPGLEDRRIYTDPVKVINFIPPDQDFRLVYTVSRGGSEPPDPTPDSPTAADLRIEAEEGKEETLILKLLPIFPERGRRGKIKTIRFGFDRKRPELPQVEGIPENAISPDRATIRLEAVDEDDRYYLLIGETEEEVLEADPVAAGELYTKPLLLEVEPGTEREFFIRLAALDPAGNRNIDPGLYRVTIDRLAPPLPEVTGIPETRVSAEDLNLRFSSDEASRIEYRILPTDAIQGPETVPFQSYQDGLTIPGREDGLKTFQLEFRSIDKAGNISAETGKFVLTIDKRPITQPEKPAVKYRDDEGYANLSWRIESGKRLFYRLGSEGDFSEYRSPISIAMGGARTPLLEYYLATETGLSSAIHTYQLSGRSSLDTVNLVSGAEDATTYAEDVLIRPVLGNGGIIRYEFTLGDSLPRLSPYSPVLDDEIRFSIPEGSTKRFRLVFGLFESADSQLPRMREELEFTIDRSPPPPPLLTELINPEPDSPYKLIELDGRGNRTYYTIAAPNSDGEDFVPYRTTLRLDTREEAGETVKIFAYTEDTVGNRSRIESWSVLLDQDIVYVSPLGNDLFEGTRLRPFRSLEKAVSMASRLGKGTLYLAEGNYPVQRTVNLDFPLEISGGLDPESWRPSGISIIDTGRYFPPNETILRLRDRHRLSRLRLSDSAGRVRVPLVALGAAVELFDVGQLAGAEFSRLIEQQRGTLWITDTILSAEVELGLIYSENGAVEICNSELSAPRAGEALLRLFGGSLRVENSLLLPGAGERSQAIEVTNAFTTLNGSEISSGGGSRQAKAILIRGGELRIEDTLLRGENSAQTSILIDAMDAELHCLESRFELGGRNGAVGILTRGGRAHIRHTDFRSRAKPGYLFLLQQRDGIIELENTTANLAARSEPVLVDLQGGRLTLLHNSWLVSSERGRPSGIQTGRGAQLYITNTILSNADGKEGLALRGADEDSWSIRHSNLGGWNEIAQYGGEVAAETEELNLLDGDPFGGWLHGNIEEPPAESFRGELYRLREESACVDGGIESGSELLDIDGEKRPNPDHGIRPFPDIGADEFYAAR